MKVEGRGDTKAGGGKAPAPGGGWRQRKGHPFLRRHGAPAAPPRPQSSSKSHRTGKCDAGRVCDLLPALETTAQFSIIGYYLACTGGCSWYSPTSPEACIGAEINLDLDRHPGRMVYIPNLDNAPLNLALRGQTQKDLIGILKSLSAFVVD